jgi:hypothetical protein
VPQGSIVRFGVDTEGIELHVDVLVDKATAFAIRERGTLKRIS